MIVQQGILTLQTKLATIIDTLTNPNGPGAQVNGLGGADDDDMGAFGGGVRSPDAYEPPEIDAGGLGGGGFTAYGQGAMSNGGNRSAWGGGGTTPYGATPYGATNYGGF